VGLFLNFLLIRSKTRHSKLTIHSQKSIQRKNYSIFVIHSPKSFIRSNCRIGIHSRSAIHCDSYFRPIRIHPFKRSAQVAQKPFIQTIIIHSSTWNVNITPFCLCASPPLAYTEKYACRMSPWWQESSATSTHPSSTRSCRTTRTHRELEDAW
jgi:hypothetical protein